MSTQSQFGSRRLLLRGLAHAWGLRQVLSGMDLELKAGRILALVGPSGCGKTTLMHLAAGLLPLQKGHREMGFREPAMLFQQPRLLPWMDARDNIALALKARGMGRTERHRRASTVARAMGLDERELRQHPAELSGGMLSRVAMARAMALDPDLLMLDEPFGALDVGLKSQLYRLLLEQRERLGLAVLMITHDLMEAVRLADEVWVMAANPGRIVHRHVPAVPALQRDDAQVYAWTASLLQLSAVKRSFGLQEDELVPSEPEGDAPPHKLARLSC